MSEEQKKGKTAVILLRGMINMDNDVRETLKFLGLQSKNSCVIIESNPVNMGMVKKCKDFVTYGEISSETLEELEKKRGRKKGWKNYALHPPRGGFERKGTKKSYSEKGSLGYRGEKINDLIRKMI